jgi:hypothetical protein
MLIFGPWLQMNDQAVKGVYSAVVTAREARIYTIEEYAELEDDEKNDATKAKRSPLERSLK